MILEKSGCGMAAVVKVAKEICTAEEAYLTQRIEDRLHSS